MSGPLSPKPVSGLLKKKAMNASAKLRNSLSRRSRRSSIVIAVEIGDVHDLQICSLLRPSVRHSYWRSFFLPSTMIIT
ncbi:unnamed protein product [Prunus armeniaca]|uniref:Uncharacterized protein n=1 Tax=Prunus armeniaca TaxID=36596 RepID=A0A6J5Y3K5_PRUAR|nr:hypothetical protein GBA52_022478 [Prunus armeniaca]CAB4288630.1 unnamed protein product [Prunus armeniaca]CAB4318997.1 unnamed protein product [Prunus armeniaca]